MSPVTPRVRDLERQVARLQSALDVPLRETILAAIEHMPADAAPEHLAVLIESQVRSWQALTAASTPSPESGGAS
jgi:hypothetical protein